MTLWNIILRCKIVFESIQEQIFHIAKPNKLHILFCVGYGRTGTMSLTKALRLLNYKATHFMRAGIEPKEGWIKYIKKSKFNAFVDDPMFKIPLSELDKIPNAKFILTTRKSDSWRKSVLTFFKYSLYHPKNIDEYENQYNQYNEHIRKYFKNKDNFLELKIEDKNKWEKLCSFLHEKKPTKPYPHKNKKHIVTLYNTFMSKLPKTLTRYVTQSSLANKQKYKNL